jgi:suppressor of ftsI
MGALSPLIRCGRAWLLVAIVAGTSLAQPDAKAGPTDVAPATAPGLHTLAYPPAMPNLSTVPHTVEVTLTAAPTTMDLVPGKPTRVYAYNGRIPGPTLEVSEGDRVIVHFHNQLPEPTTVHWHGLHIPVEADGNPTDTIPPGGSYDYVFPVLAGQAGTYWYHPHPHHLIGHQVAKGLFGAIIVHAAKDPLPASLPDKLLLLSDTRVNGNHSVVFPPGGDINGWEGNVLMVNGQIHPAMSIRSGEVQRWRIVNASSARFYRLALEGHTFLQVGSDGGLFEQPVERKEILLAPAERVEVLVRATGAPGSRSLLQTLPYDRYILGYRPADWNKTLDVLTLQYAAGPAVHSPAIPSTLRPVPAIDPSKVTAQRKIVFKDAIINGKMFDHNRVDITVPLNATEIWVLENKDEMDHPFHLHGFSFQILDRDGVPEPFRAWKDTVVVRKKGTVRIIVEFKDYPGKRMFHCHILDHEDYGMMATLDVRATPGSPVGP